MKNMKKIKQMKKKSAISLALLSSALILAGCAQPSAPIVDGNAGIGPTGPGAATSTGTTSDQAKVTTHGLNDISGFSGKELANYESQINNVDGYSLEQKNTLIKSLSAMPKKVLFAFDSFKLSQESKQDADKVANMLTEFPKENLRIAGHTDPRGSEEYNFNLGQRRANSVKDYLLAKGVSSNQLCTVSYGELQPAATPAEYGGDKEAVYHQDRRAVFNFGKSCKGSNTLTQ